jgi:hypothetical protein
MQLVTTAVNVVLGFGAIAVMLRTLRWKDRLAAEEALASAATSAEPAAPPSRSVLPG